MAKYDKYIDEIKKDKAFKEEQRELHQKHEHIDEDKVIVEKNVAVKATLTFTENIAKAIIGVILILLATVGILTLLYPETRSAFLTLLDSMLKQIKTLI